MTKDKKSLYSIPPGWATAQLSQLIGAHGLFVDGDWIESKDQNPKGEVRLIQLADIGDGFFVDKSARFLTLQKANELKCTFLQYDDILIARMPEPLGRACLFPLEEDESYVTAVDVCIFRPHSELLCRKFLMHMINSPYIRKIIDSYKSGSTRKRISRSNLDKVTIPIAPLAEQKSIVCKIEELFSELDAGVESLKKAKEQLAVYRQSLLKQAFEGKLTADWRKENIDKLESGDALLKRVKQEREKYYKKQHAQWEKDVKRWEAGDKAEKKPSEPQSPKELSPIHEDQLRDLPQLPEGWIWIKLGALPLNVFDGPFGSNLKGSDYVDSGVRVIRLENIGELNFIHEKESFITVDKYNSLIRHNVSGGDIIFSSFISGGTRVVILPDNLDRAINKADCFCIRIYSSYFSNGYISKFLSTRLAFKQLESEIHGATRPRINTTQLKEVIVPICSKYEQEHISRQMDMALELIKDTEKSIEVQLEKSTALRMSVLEKAFSGKLVSQEPNEESASELLKRILKERASAPKPKRKSKITAKKIRATMVNLIDVLTAAKDWVQAQKAFSQCGISNDATTDEIEKIYEELKQHIEQEAIEVERRGDDDWLRLAPKE